MDKSTIHCWKHSDYGSGLSYNTAIPPGAGSTKGRTPYIHGYTFDEWQSAISTTKHFQIPLPSSSDNKGYAVAITGVIDSNQTTFPVSLKITNNLAFRAVSVNAP